MEKIRCEWCLKDKIYQDYHDDIWGKPEHDDRKLFEMLCLEGAQAGLSWYTVLIKMENYRKAFDNWDPKKIAKYNQAKIDKILLNPGVIRNKLKIKSVVTNAIAYLEVVEEFGSFDKYIWSFVGGKPIINKFKTLAEIPALTDESTAMSKDLKKRGFKFVGSTICYAYMQACGMVNDHILSCWARNGK